MGFVVGAADEDPPEVLKLPPPSVWGDGNRIEDTLIANNVITGFLFHGISVAASTGGSQRNVNHSVQIRDNTISGRTTDREGVFGMWIGSASDLSSFRSTSDNIIDSVDIRANHVTNVVAGIVISGGGKGGDDRANASQNRLMHVVIADNDLAYWINKRGSDLLPAGIRIWGGYAQSAASAGISANAVSDVRITGNRFSPDNDALKRADYVHDTVGVELIGGVSFFGGKAFGNVVSDVAIVDNRFSGNTKNNIAVRVVGGTGDGATDNRVQIAEIHGNSVEPKAIETRVVADDQAAARNTATIPAEPSPSQSPSIVPSVAPAASTVPPVAAEDSSLPITAVGLTSIAVLLGVLLVRRARRSAV